MLRELRIRNFALIDELEVSFEPGLNVITGETGAGKTILMHALGLSVGGKAPNDVIRTGEDEASIEAVFATAAAPIRDRLAAAGIENADEELLIRRVVSLRGRNRVHLNGMLATLAVLESAGEGLIRVYGQHEHHTLRQAELHLGLVDAFAAHENLVGAMRERWAVFHALDERLRRLTEGKEVARARAELLRFQSREIAAARLRAGEEEELRRERQVLGSAEKLVEAVTSGEELLYAGDTAAAPTLQKLARRLGELAAVDPRLEEIGRLLDEAGNLAGEAGFRLREYAQGLTFDPGRLEEVEERLALVQKLKRKYGESVEAILAHKETVDRELSDLDLGEEGLETLRKERAAAETAAREAAAALSTSRRAAAKRLESRLVGELADLGMKGARVEVRFEETPLGESGTDAVELFLAANPGEAPRPLARIASGGELSRIMLALKTIALEEVEAPTLVFDEVDAGIGGAVAEVVGRKLAGLARKRQILCITHLAQIAAYADHHFAVTKTTAKGRTRSLARRLETKERVTEVARMIGGLEATVEARKHAERLLAAARRSPG